MISPITRPPLLLPLLAVLAIGCARPVTSLSHSDPAAFWRAAREGDLPAVLQALDNGRDVNAALVLPGDPDTGGTALHYAARQNHPELAASLLSRGADPNARALDRHAATPLHWAASRGHADMVTLLLAAGARHDLPDNHGFLPLDLTHLPSVGGRERGSITRLALQKAGARGSDRPGTLPWADPDLWAAILEDNLQAARIAIDTGADPNATDPVSGASPLLLATIHGRGEIVSFLASRGARLDAPAADGATPLIAAAYLGRADLVRLLLRLGADQACRGKDGKTALDQAATPWTRDTEIQCRQVMRATGIHIDIEQVQAGRVTCAAVLSGKKP